MKQFAILFAAVCVMTFMGGQEAQAQCGGGFGGYGGGFNRGFGGFSSGFRGGSVYRPVYRSSFGGGLSRGGFYGGGFGRSYGGFSRGGFRY